MVHADVNEDLQDAHPDWRLWRSRRGSWMATRLNALSDAEIFAGMASTLMEATADDLVERLVEQQRIADVAA